MSLFRLPIVCSFAALGAFAYFTDVPKHHAFERVKIVERFEDTSGATKMQVQLSNNQLHQFTVKNMIKTPLVNNMICAEIMRGTITGRLKLEMVKMESCPLPFADTRRIRSKPVAKTQPKAFEHPMGKEYPQLGNSLISK